MAEVSQQIDLGERHREDATRRHALAMEAIGLIRTALHLQRPTYEALIAAWESGSVGPINGLPPGGKKSFAIQVRMAKAALGFLQEIDGLANEAIEMAAKEKIDA